MNYPRATSALLIALSRGRRAPRPAAQSTPRAARAGVDPALRIAFANHDGFGGDRGHRGTGGAWRGANAHRPATKFGRLFAWTARLHLVGLAFTQRDQQLATGLHGGVARLVGTQEAPQGRKRAGRTCCGYGQRTDQVAGLPCTTVHRRDARELAMELRGTKPQRSPNQRAAGATISQMPSRNVVFAEIAALPPVTSPKIFFE